MLAPSQRLVIMAILTLEVAEQKRDHSIAGRNSALEKTDRGAQLFPAKTKLFSFLKFSKLLKFFA